MERFDGQCTRHLVNVDSCEKVGIVWTGIFCQKLDEKHNLALLTQRPPLRSGRQTCITTESQGTLRVLLWSIPPPPQFTGHRRVVRAGVPEFVYNLERTNLLAQMKRKAGVPSNVWSNQSWLFSSNTKKNSHCVSCLILAFIYFIFSYFILALVSLQVKLFPCETINPHGIGCLSWPCRSKVFICLETNDENRKYTSTTLNHNEEEPSISKSALSALNFCSTFPLSQINGALTTRNLTRRTPLSAI